MGVNKKIGANRHPRPRMPTPPPKAVGDKWEGTREGGPIIEMREVTILKQEILSQIITRNNHSTIQETADYMVKVIDGLFQLSAGASAFLCDKKGEDIDD